MNTTRSSLRSRGRAILSVALVVLGLARVVGFYSGFFPISVLAGQLGASPLPLVFSQVRGVETYSRRFAIDLEMEGGTVIVVPGDWTFRKRLNGPFTRAKLYVDEIAFADLTSERRRRAVLTHAFCRGGVVARELGLSGTVARIVLRLWSAKADESAGSRIEIGCAE